MDLLWTAIRLTLSLMATLHELSPIPLSETKPTNRGKFSTEREYWEQTHERRYVQWQLGDGVEEIAAGEAVTYNAVKHSILWCEARLPRAEVLAGRAARLRLQTFARLSERYVTELERLMDDPNPIIRSRTLEHFRRTTGMESGAGVHVAVNTAVAQPSVSFESMLDAVKQRHFEEERERNARALEPKPAPQLLGSAAADQDSVSKPIDDPDRQTCYRDRFAFCLHCLYLSLD